MIILARFDSVCPVCKRAIEAGYDYVEWKPGEKARHAKCVDPKADYVQCPYCYGAKCDVCRNRGFMRWSQMSGADQDHFHHVNK
jgi:hypothetical protein